MDERQKNLIASAMAKVLVIVYIVVLIIGITKLIVSRSILSCLFELIFVTGVPVLVYIFIHSRKNVSFPTSIAGLAVKPDSNSRAFKGRIMAYIFDSLQYSSVISVFIFAMDIWNAHSDGSLAKFGVNEWLDSVGNMLIQFMILFAIYFAMDFFMFEFRAKKVREQKERKLRREKSYKKIMENKDEKES
ncbi:MAG: hypothetical protein IIZ08_05975 [Clostridia bacterium]|jgi:hypothetical protein|nr:hypothetical protein [Clostridia bacterium]